MAMAVTVKKLANFMTGSRWREGRKGGMSSAEHRMDGFYKFKTAQLGLMPDLSYLRCD